jgi:hypothetical protein
MVTSGFRITAYWKQFLMQDATTLASPPQRKERRPFGALFSFWQEKDAPEKGAPLKTPGLLFVPHLTGLLKNPFVSLCTVRAAAATSRRPVK